MTGASGYPPHMVARFDQDLAAVSGDLDMVVSTWERANAELSELDALIAMARFFTPVPHDALVGVIIAALRRWAPQRPP
jgi:hypothetical protein